MLIDIIGDCYQGRSTLTAEQSRSLLDFCLASGVTLFTVDFLVSTNDNSHALCDQIYRRFSPFLSEKLVLEEIEDRGFALHECWKLDHASINLILKETTGDLFANKVLELPEDWVFYRGDSIFFQIVNHEQEGILRLTDAEYAAFKKLEIPHGQGRVRWASLPDTPNRMN
jgi:hypothetical protein